MPARSASTFKSTSTVTASFKSFTYEPCQRKVLLPRRTSRPPASTSRPAKTWNKLWGASSPTTPTSRTRVKKEAA